MDKEHDERMMLFQHGAEEIREIKKLEWLIPNYVLALFAASIGFTEVVTPDHLVRCLVLYFDTFVFLVGTVYLIIVNSDLRKFRKRVDDIMRTFERGNIEIYTNGGSFVSAKVKDWIFIGTFIIIMFCGLAATIYFLINWKGE